MQTTTQTTVATPTPARVDPVKIWLEANNQMPGTILRVRRVFGDCFRLTWFKPIDITADPRKTDTSKSGGVIKTKFLRVHANPSGGDPIVTEPAQ